MDRRCRVWGINDSLGFFQCYFLFMTSLHKKYRKNASKVLWKIDLIRIMIGISSL